MQKAIADGQGSQCGFCTPGWVSAMEAMLARSAVEGQPPLDAKAIETSLDGNLCRCTGYRPILQAFKDKFAPDGEATMDGEHGECCKDKPKPPPSSDIEDLGCTDCHDTQTQQPCGRKCDEVARRARAVTAAPPFAVARAKEPRALSYTDAATSLEYHRPTTMASLLDLLGAQPDARLVAANTGMGVGKYYTPEGATGAGGLPPQRDASTIDLSAVKELATPPALDKVTGRLSFGATVTLETLIDAMDAAAEALPATKPVASALARHLRRVATTQVRGFASWAGNICLAASKGGATGKLPSDVLTLFAGVGATLTVAARAGPNIGQTRQVGVAE